MCGSQRLAILPNTSILCVQSHAPQTTQLVHSALLKYSSPFSHMTVCCVWIAVFGPPTFLWEGIARDDLEARTLDNLADLLGYYCFDFTIFFTTAVLLLYYCSCDLQVRFSLQFPTLHLTRTTRNSWNPTRAKDSQKLSNGTLFLRSTAWQETNETFLNGVFSHGKYITSLVLNPL